MQNGVKNFQFLPSRENMPINWKMFGKQRVVFGIRRLNIFTKQRIFFVVYSYKQISLYNNVVGVIIGDKRLCECA